MVRPKPEVAGKTAKSKEHPAVTRIKKLEKRVAKLEKEKEEDRRHAKLWKANYLKEQRDFEERAWRLIAKRRNDLEAKVPSTLEKRVSKLEKGRGKEEVQWHTKWDFEEKAWRRIAKKRNDLEAEVGKKPSKATPKTTKHSAQVI